jgi:hypothetical protein
VFYAAEMIRCEQCICSAKAESRIRCAPRIARKLRQWAENNPERARRIPRGQELVDLAPHNPFPLIAYAKNGSACENLYQSC